MLRPRPPRPWTELPTSTTYVQRGGVGPRLADNYTGPYLVLEKGPKVFKLQLGTRQEVVSRDRLKPHLGLAPPAAGDPPRGHLGGETRSSSRLQKICGE